MATPMALGPFMFQSLQFGFNGISRNLSTRWADIQIAGGLDRLQWTGGDNDTWEIRGVIFPEEFGGLRTMEKLRQAAAAGEVLPLISLGGDVYGMCVIEAVSEDQSYHDWKGLPRMDAYRISLKRYPGGVFTPMSIVKTLFG